MFLIKTIRYLILFSIVNFYAIKLGGVSAYKDKTKRKECWISLLLFFAGMVCGILYML